MTDQREPVMVSMGVKLLDSEGMDGADLDTNAALVDGAAVMETLQGYKETAI